MRFSRRNKEEFNKWWKELVESSFENINKRDKRGKMILHHAVEILDQKKVKLLIEKGAEVNAEDLARYRPLHLAVMAQRLENVKELIKGGAEVNVVERGSKSTPLHFACVLWAKEIVEELLKAGANVEQKDKSGKTPMDYARNNKEITEVLENAKIANKQGEFLEKLTVISESTVAGVIEAREELEAVKESSKCEC